MRVSNENKITVMCNCCNAVLTDKAGHTSFRNYYEVERARKRQGWTYTTRKDYCPKCMKRCMRETEQ